MEAYPSQIQEMMRRLYKSLNERDRRRYAAVESAKFGHGGLNYISEVLGCDPNTIQAGLLELQSNELDTSRQRKKGLDASD